MKEILNKFIDKYGILALIMLPFYPVTLLFWGPYRLAATMWNARVFAKGRWSEYMGFSALHSINQLFYRTQILNIDRYGRSGISPYLSLGNFPIGNWWHISLPASYLYWIMGGVLPLVSLFGWWSMHFFWFIDPNIDLYWGGIVLFLTLFSSSFFANTFVTQNYNALGWLFFPLGLWGMLHGYYPITALAWLAASFGSITVVFIAGILSLSYAVYTNDFWIMIVILPAGFKILLHFYWSLSKIQSKIDDKPTGIKAMIVNVLKVIGAISTDVKYKRRALKGMQITPLYLLILYLQFGISLYWLVDDLNLLWWTAVVMFVINSFYIRFSDNQSMNMMILSIATITVLMKQDILILLSFWLVISPIPLFLEGKSEGSMLNAVKPLKPYNIKVIIDKVEIFLKKIEIDSRVLCAFNNPMGEYEKIFDGYRSLYEVPRYIASKNNFLLFPDWWAIMENNYEGAQEFWGRDADSINKNIKAYNATHVLIYTDNEMNEVEVLSRIDACKVSELDLKSYFNRKGERLYFGANKDIPKWILLKVNN
jgi:hypothetical protein